MVVWIRCCHRYRLVVCECLIPLVGLEVDLDIFKCPIHLCKLVGMSRVSIHMAVRVGCSTVREEVHNLVDSLLVVG
jgi:hypothetical protein